MNDFIKYENDQLKRRIKELEEIEKKHLELNGELREKIIYLEEQNNALKIALKGLL